VLVVTRLKAYIFFVVCLFSVFVVHVICGFTLCFLSLILVLVFHLIFSSCNRGGLWNIKVIFYYTLCLYGSVGLL